ncbi:hypothetical protein [uncultured Gilliamella sp.]|nr:hypothetical protein [uncultured Gilliamella sp.]
MNFGCLVDEYCHIQVVTEVDHADFRDLIVDVLHNIDEVNR